jgi:hypothetical protein
MSQSDSAGGRTQRELQILGILTQGSADIEAGVGLDLEAVMADAAALLQRPIT